MKFTIYNLQFTKNTKKRFENWSLKIGNFREAGMSLLEILIVVAIFSILGVLVTRAVLLTIGGSRKSESLVKVRENLDYAAGVIERQLRNANSISVCPNTDTSVINYMDADGNPANFSCVGIGSGSGYIASGSAALTSSDVNVTSCSFTCQAGASLSPSVVAISLAAKEASASGIQNATVTVDTQVSLRNY